MSSWLKEREKERESKNDFRGNRVQLFPQAQR